MRRGFRRLLEDDPAIAVVGEASDGEEAIALAATLKPRVVVMDCAMPGTSRPDRDTKRSSQRAPDIAVLMLSMHCEADAGAPGARRRRARLHSEECAGSRPGGRGQARAAGETVLDPKRRPADGAEGRARPGLTPRELEVLQLICDGLSNRAIAAKLGLSVNTVAVHRANIMNALGVHKTAELVVYAIQNGLVNAAVNRRDFLRDASAARLAAWRAARAAVAAARSATGRPAFRLVDVTAAAGLQFRHNNGAYGGKLLPETLGAGCAFLDYDADGWQDILLVNGMDWPGHKRSDRRSSSIATTATARSRTSRAPPAWTSSCTEWASRSAISTTTASPTCWSPASARTGCSGTPARERSSMSPARAASAAGGVQHLGAVV